MQIVYTEKPHSKYLDNTTSRAVAQRDNHSCCITGTRGRFWNSSGVFPVVPPTAFYIKEVMKSYKPLCAKLLTFRIETAP